MLSYAALAATCLLGKEQSAGLTGKILSRHAAAHAQMKFGVCMDQGNTFVRHAS